MTALSAAKASDASAQIPTNPTCLVTIIARPGRRPNKAVLLIERDARGAIRIFRAPPTRDTSSKLIILSAAIRHPFN